MLILLQMKKCICGNDMQLWFSLAMFNNVANIQQEIQNNYAHFIW